MEMFICLSWEGASLVKVFIVGFCFPVCWHLCSLLCSDVRILWPEILHSPFFKWLKIIPDKSPVKGWTFFETLQWLKRHHVVPVWGWVHVPASHNQLSFLATPCQDMCQWWYARSSYAERGMQQVEALPLFCWEMLTPSHGSFLLGSSAGVFTVSLRDYRSQR